MRVYCNLCLTCLALNKSKEAIGYNNSVLEVIRKESVVEERINLLKEVVYIYFRIDSLQKYYENCKKTLSDEEENKEKNVEGNVKDKEINLNQIQQNNENINTKRDSQHVISRTLFYIHKFLRGKI